MQSLDAQHRPTQPRLAEPAKAQCVSSPRHGQLAQLAAGLNARAARAANATGLPGTIKSGVEALSGISMDGVKVHYNSPAPAQLNAHAYAQGTDIHLAPGQEKHLPHEAWHVVQQAQGRVAPTKQLQTTSINDDPALEEEADQMAGSLTQAAPTMAPAQRMRAGAMTIQRAISINNVNQGDAGVVWNRISGDAAITALTAPQQLRARAILKSWISAPTESVNPFRTSEARSYPNDAELIQALVGEVQSEAQLVTEGTLAQGTMDNAVILQRLGNFIVRLRTWQVTVDARVATAANAARGRYNSFYGGIGALLGGGSTIGQALAAPPGDLNGRIALISDYALGLRHTITNHAGGWSADVFGNNAVGGAGNVAGGVGAGLNAARRTHWNTNEGAGWTQQARANNAPLSAGPSATTGQILTLANKVDATDNEKEALAWAIFAFFNKSLKRHKSGTHRFHEVMSVAVNYGVPYVAWAYPANEPDHQ
jgi:hypothetical protein